MPDLNNARSVGRSKKKKELQHLISKKRNEKVHET
jgi:hypothetical protein